MFVGWMQRCVPENIDLIVPVPLHWRRFLLRQYNQSAELAKMLSKNTNIPCELNLLKRHRATPSQGHKRIQERYENLRQAFSIKDLNNILDGKRILLIDDVLTSGATVSACTKVLKKAGVKEVHVLTITRVVRDKNFYNKHSDYYGA
jgi:ComF family protein